MSGDALPEGWEERPLRDCVDVLDNLRVPVNSDERARRPGTIPYYGATGQVGWIDDFIFDEELLLLGEDGAPFLEKSKDVAYVVRGKTWVNNHAHVLRPRTDTVSTLFLKHYLNSFDYADHVNGTTRLKLTQGSMNSIPVPLPPLAEQKRIVAKVEELLASVNAARDRLVRVPAILKRFRQAVLEAACDGRLTEDWRESQPSAEGPSSDEGLELPAGWKKISAGSEYLRADYGTSVRCEREPEGTPVLRVPNIASGRLDITNLKYAPSESADLSALTVAPGDILICRTNGSLDLIGKAAVVHTLPLPFSFASYLIRVRLHGERMIPAFFHLFLESPLGRGQIEERARTTAGQFNLNLGILRELALMVPTIPEQREIVRRVEALFNLADAIERRVATATFRAEKIAQAILAKAFCGELLAPGLKGV